METPTNKPVHEIRVASVKAAIWSNALPNGVRHSVTLTRLYKDGDAWKSSSSFNRDDLLVLGRIATAAFDWIVANQKREPTE